MESDRRVDDWVRFRQLHRRSAGPVVESRHEDAGQPGRFRACKYRLAVGIELVIIKMTVGIGEIHGILVKQSDYISLESGRSTEAAPENQK